MFQSETKELKKKELQGQRLPEMPLLFNRLSQKTNPGI